MQLTKLEMAIVLGAFVQGLGEEAINNNESKLLKQLEDKLDEIVNNSTPNQMKEAGESVVNKFILGLLEEKKPKRFVLYHADTKSDTLSDKLERKMDYSANIVNMVVQ